jgi:CHASE2 domain-containing sensor protein
MMVRVAPYAKAVVAAIIAGLTAIATGLVSDGLSWSEVVAALIAFFVALGAVFRVRNRIRR